MTVGRDTRAVGAATTSTVVQSIVAVILLDAAFAVLLQALGFDCRSHGRCTAGTRTASDADAWTGRPSSAHESRASDTGHRGRRHRHALRRADGARRRVVRRSARHAGGADRRQRHRQVGAAARDDRPAAADRRARAAARHRHVERATAEARRRAAALRHDVPGRRAVLVADGGAERRRAAARAHAARAGARIDALVALRLRRPGCRRRRRPRCRANCPAACASAPRIARAIALEPEILFLDEPTSGLDPITARAFDRLVRSLVDDLGITVFLVTHDLDTLLTVVDRLIVLARGQVLADGPVQRGDGASTTPGSATISRSVQCSTETARDGS